MRGSPAGPLPQPRALALFSWTRFPVACEKHLWGALGLIAPLVPSCDNRPQPIAGPTAAGLGPAPTQGLSSQAKIGGGEAKLGGSHSALCAC